MKKELGIGYCGLVCALCSENLNCMGCKRGGCKDKENCKCYRCCTEKNFESCAECEEFPCEDSILHKLRIRAFCKFQKEYGTETLIDCLKKNEQSGIQYHYPNEIVGDYDACSSEHELYEMLLEHHKISKI